MKTQKPYQEVKEKTILTVSQEILDNLETSTRNDGTEYVHMKDHNIEWIKDIIRGAHLDRMPSDDIYARIQDILTSLISCKKIDYESEKDS